MSTPTPNFTFHYTDFKGLQDIINNYRKPHGTNLDEIEDDFDGEREALEAFKSSMSGTHVSGDLEDVQMSGPNEHVPDLVDIPDDDDDDNEDPEAGHSGPFTGKLDDTVRAVLKDASKGITEDTEAEYKR
jgi:hypothetical protein